MTTAVDRPTTATLPTCAHCDTTEATEPLRLVADGLGGESHVCAAHDEPTLAEQQAAVRAAWSKAGKFTGNCECRRVDGIRGTLDVFNIDARCSRCGLGHNLD